MTETANIPPTSSPSTPLDPLDFIRRGIQKQKETKRRARVLEIRNIRGKLPRIETDAARTGSEHLLKKIRKYRERLILLENKNEASETSASQASYPSVHIRDRYQGLT